MPQQSRDMHVFLKLRTCCCACAAGGPGAPGAPGESAFHSSRTGPSSGSTGGSTGGPTRTYTIAELQSINSQLVSSTGGHLPVPAGVQLPDYTGVLGGG